MNNRPFSLLVKPASGDCNLRCQYCFYWYQHQDFYPETTIHRMSDKVLNKLIQTYMATNQPSYQIGWQGGEPTMMGVEFFRKVTELQIKYGKPGAMIGNGLQTNGTLINDKWARFLNQRNFLTGISLDGPQNMHDHYRLNANDKGTFDSVMKGINHLKQNNAEFNILTLVNDVNVKHPAEVYTFLKNNNFLFHQYIACVEPDKNHQLLPFSITGKEWGNFLCTIFDLWYKADTRKVSVRLFDSVLALLVDGTRNQCSIGQNCCQYLVVEYNGDVYPCDFFVEERYKLGNIMQDSWQTLLQHPTYIKFGKQKTQWNTKCDSCPYNWICVGDCLKHRLCANGGDPQRLSILCEGLAMFYQYTMPRFKILAEQIIIDRQQTQQTQMPQDSKIGRNDPCPCGSGKKYKKCCGK